MQVNFDECYYFVVDLLVFSEQNSPMAVINQDHFLLILPYWQVYPS
jgi:hypothetical protein